MGHRGFGLGKFDKSGREICCGDTVLYLNESEHTKREYWYPIYKVVWDSPCFRLQYMGGGRGACNSEFILRHYPGKLLVLGEAE